MTNLITEYITACGTNLPKLDQDVNAYIALGWHPYGNVYVMKTVKETATNIKVGERLCQPMVKYKEKDLTYPNN